MAPSKENMLSNSREERTEVETEKEKLERGLDKLWMLCNVLGILYKTKIAEFGPVVTVQRVDEAVKFLTVTRDANFEKLKETSERMIEAWQLCNTSVAKVQNFYWIYLIKEAEKADQILDWNVLSTASVTKAKAEVYRLNHEREQKIEKKYNMKKSKLIKMIADTHLTPTDFQFDTSQKVDTKYYKTQKGQIKAIIRDVKQESCKRKELVVRLEMAKKVVHNTNLSSEEKLAVISYAEFAARRMKECPILYDGQTAEAILEDLRRKANHVDAQVIEDVVEVTEELPRTRSGKAGRH